jgi:hypothetical protein
MKWITPNNKKSEWTYGDIRFYGLVMALGGVVLGFLMSITGK